MSTSRAFEATFRHLIAPRIRRGAAPGEPSGLAARTAMGDRGLSTCLAMSMQSLKPAMFVHPTERASAVLRARPPAFQAETDVTPGTRQHSTGRGRARTPRSRRSPVPAPGTSSSAWPGPATSVNTSRASSTTWSTTSISRTSRSTRRWSVVRTGRSHRAVSQSGSPASCCRSTGTRLEGALQILSFRRHERGRIARR